FKDRLKGLISMLRQYGNNLIDGLTLDELLWRPEGTRGRTIQSYFRHIINAEIYWLKSLEDHSFEYLPKEVEFSEFLKRYNNLESHLAQSLDNSTEEQLKVRVPLFEDDKLQKKGTLAWMIMRTSLHAIHHYGQISHIRYSIEKPPLKNLDVPTWGKIMDTFSFLNPPNLE
ncbi:MAG: DinB family protein, partial [Candidatus Kariarchaeaceae archaeon]